MKLVAITSTLLVLTLGGCKPVGTCEYDEVELSPQYVTPWGTVLADDVAELAGPFPGTFTWLDGGDVVTVPRAGEEVEVEAEIAFDLSTARMGEYIREPPPGRREACPPDKLFVDGTVSFVRPGGGEVELSVPVTAFAYRSGSPGQYFVDAEPMPPDAFASGLEPLLDHDHYEIVPTFRWASDDGKLHGEFTYAGRTMPSPTTEQGDSKKIAAFVPD